MAAPFTQEPGPVRRAAWEQGMTDAGAAVQVFRYAGAGHLFTDPSLPDHNGQGATLAWQRSLSFLSDL
jgi:dienelactone hydrolase